MIRVIFVFLVMLTSACRTIGGRSRHVSVDSNPRGVEVVDKKGKSSVSPRSS